MLRNEALEDVFILIRGAFNLHTGIEINLTSTAPIMNDNSNIYNISHWISDLDWFQPNDGVPF